MISQDCVWHRGVDDYDEYEYDDDYDDGDDDDDDGDDDDDAFLDEWFLRSVSGTEALREAAAEMAPHNYFGCFLQTLTIHGFIFWKSFPIFENRK